MTILEEAEALVNGPRQAEYGHPSVNLQRAADIWSAVLGAPVTSRQVCLCMAGLKLARAANGDARDSIVDLVGYVRLIEMCETAPVGVVDSPPAAHRPFLTGPCANCDEPSGSVVCGRLAYQPDDWGGIAVPYEPCPIGGPRTQEEAGTC